MVKSIVAILLALFLGYAMMAHDSAHLERVSIKIKTRDDDRMLISKKEVRGLLTRNLGFDLSIANKGQLNLYELEAALESDERISRAEIYIDKRGRMVIGIIQNLPIVRVKVSGGEDYYLDADGSRVPKAKSGVRVPVVTGNIDKYTADFKKKKSNNLNYVHTLSKLLYEDDFLNGLVGQIEIDENDEIVLVPILGRKKINIGPVEGLEDKMDRLKTYYEKGIKNIGIDRFDLLDLRYEGQIVGSRTES